MRIPLESWTSLFGLSGDLSRLIMQIGIPLETMFLRELTISEGLARIQKLVRWME
jgi:hypothetical protein